VGDQVNRRREEWAPESVRCKSHGMAKERRCVCEGPRGEGSSERKGVGGRAKEGE
jgi:hypothetical protein